MRGAVSEIHRLVRGRIVVVESVLPNGLTVSLPSRPSVLTVRFSLAPLRSRFDPANTYEFTLHQETIGVIFEPCRLGVCGFAGLRV